MTATQNTPEPRHHEGMRYINTVTLGNILTVLSILMVLMGSGVAYGTLAASVKYNEMDLVAVKVRLDTKDVQDVAVGKMLSELGVDVRWLRRQVEAENRDGRL